MYPVSLRFLMSVLQHLMYMAVLADEASDRREVPFAASKLLSWINEKIGVKKLQDMAVAMAILPLCCRRHIPFQKLRFVLSQVPA